MHVHIKRCMNPNIKSLCMYVFETSEEHLHLNITTCATIYEIDKII